MPPRVPSDLLTREPATPTESDALASGHQLTVRDLPASTTYNPGQGIFNPQDISNVGFYVLFALIGVAFVLASIWFFFWAKNGGFHFKKGDWDDYKSTVLRRKGPDGKTLSNATKSTKLGGGSVVGSDYTDTTASTSQYTDLEKGKVQEKVKKEKRDKQPRHHKRGNRHDADVRAYREEKAARVGGINKAPEGTSYDGSTNPSTSQPAMSEVRGSRYHTPRGDRPRRDFSYHQGSEATFSVASDDVPPPRPKHSTPASQQYKSNRERRSQGYYASRASEGSFVDPIDFGGSKTQSSNASVAQVQNTKAYKHTIPGLTKGPGAPKSGFRRGGGRRDSLSDSDGDETYRS